MTEPIKDDLEQLGIDRSRTVAEDRTLAEACIRVITSYRASVAKGQPGEAEMKQARKAFLHLGGDPMRSSASLKDYDPVRYGPFLVELTKRFSVLSMSTQATVELMGMTAVLYLMMSYPMSVAARRIETRLGLEQQA